MNYLIATLSLLLILACGRTLADRLTIKPAGLYQHPSIAFALGLGFVTVCNFLVSFVVPNWGMRLTAGFTLFLSLFQLKQWRTYQPKRWVLPALLYGLMGIPATQTGLGHDNIAFWGYKANFIFLWGGWRETAVWMPHPDYPLLVPTGQAWVYTALGQIDEPASKLFFVACFVALIMLFHHVATHLTSTRLAHLFTLLLFATPQLTSITALSGYADVPLMLFVLGGIAFVLLWQDTADSQHLLLAGLLFGLAFWVKREGLVHFGVSFVWVTLSAMRIKQRKAIGWILLGSLPFILVWVGYLRWHEIPNYDFVEPSLTALWQNQARLWVIMEALWGQLTAVGQWGFLWGIFLLVSLAQLYNLFASNFTNFFSRKTEPSYLWLMTVMPLLMLSVAYIFSNWERGLQTHLGVSLERLVLHTVPACWLFIASVSQPLDRLWHEMLRHEMLQQEIVQTGASSQDSL